MNFKVKNLKKLILVVFSVIIMGFSLSFLIRSNFGVDPCSAMNIGIAKIVGISFGNWLLIFNFIFLVIVILFGRELIGWGTLANMVLVGYSVDLTTWLTDFFITDAMFESMFVRTAVFVPSIIIFVIAASIYISANLGVAPYDAIPSMLCDYLNKKVSIPFRLVRMVWDLTACALGFLLSNQAGIMTVLAAFLLGPLIDLTGRVIFKRKEPAIIQISE